MEGLNATNIPLLVVFLLNVGLGLLVYLKASLHRRVNISFSLFTWALAGWAFTILMIYLIREAGWRLFWVRMSFVASRNIPSTFFYFSLIFPNEKRKISLPKIIFIFLPSTIFTLTSFTELMVHSAQWETMKINYGIAHKFFSVYLLTGMFGGIFFLIKSYINSIGLERIQIKYCFLGTFITTIPAIALNLILPLLGTSKLSNIGRSEERRVGKEC